MGQVLLIYPELANQGDAGALIMPLSLVYVAYPLVKSGYSVRIIDQRVMPDWQARLREELLKGKTICVGISAMTGLQIEGGLLAAELVREFSADVPIIWGGVHPSLLPEQTAEDECVDIVVIGEGSETLLDVVRSLETKQPVGDVSGLCYKVNKKTILSAPRVNPNIMKVDASHLPYHLLPDIDLYLRNPLDYIPGAEKGAIPFLSSRGCPHSCTYCYNVRFSHQRWRACEPERVVENLDYIIRQFRTKGVFLLDDNFFANLTRVRRICELITAEGIDVRFYNVNCRLDTLLKVDIDFLKLMKAAGVESLFVGVESASRRVLKMMKKNVNVNEIFTVDEKLQNSGIIPTYSFMMGLPVEDVNDVKKTMALMSKLVDVNPNACISPQMYIPLPGSEMFDVCINKGLVVPQRLSEWAHFCESYPEDVERYVWFNEKERRFLRKVSVMKQVLDTKMNKRKGALREGLRELYSHIVRFRTRHNFYAFMPELRLREIDALKLKEKRI